MLIHDIPLPFPVKLPEHENIQPESCLFFDIETTGLSWKYSHLYLLGAVFFDGCQWIQRRWFCQRPGEERDVLLAFGRLLSEKDTLIHFNGNTFDVPYLMHKYTFYRIEQSWEHLTHLDLYRKLLPYKKLMGLSHMRQKDLELLIGLHREDPFSGEELIACYQEYLKTGDQKLLHMLLLHNLEDVQGMIRLLPLLEIPRLFSGNFSGQVSALLSGESQKEAVCLNIKLDTPLPCILTLQNSLYCLKMASAEEITLEIPLFEGTLKYFFPDYKNYYYLPLEDEAIHKSVGEYVDKEHREKAKANNCYKKTTGRFLPQLCVVFSPDFRADYKDRMGWFLFSDDFLNDSDKLTVYAAHLLSCFLSCA